MNTRPLFFAFLTVLLAGACTKGFEELNTNPNAPASVQPGLLLRQVLYNYGEQMSYEGFVAGNLLAQHFTMVDFNLFDRHDLSAPQLGGNPWPVLYSNLLDNELMLQLARTNPSFQVYEGPALILKAYMAAALTDIYGDVPYSQALRGAEGMVTPRYDSQEQIYTGEGGILDNLRLGVEAIQAYTGNLPLEGDLLYSGDLSSWIRLANSLRLKYLLRISARVDVSEHVQVLFSEGMYIQENSQNASFDFSDGRPNSFRMEQLRDGDFNLYILSKTMESVLKDLDDPRLLRFFRPVGSDPDGTQYVGLRNGPDASQTSISISNYSLPGQLFRERTGELDANFMTAWETHFLLAEAAHRGWISADARTLYELGVEQAFAYWGVSMPAYYLNEGGAAFGADGADVLEQIITQKWIANTINGYEGWIEYRRTGFPVLRPIAASLNEGLIPVRMPYPAGETTLNAENFQLATGTTDNSINARVWWDVQ